MKKNNVKRNSIIIGLLNLLMDLKLYGVIAVIYYTKVAGNMTLGMSAFSITMIASALFELPTGVISDKVGRKKTVILGTIASLTYSIIFALSKNYVWLVLGAIFEGVEIAFFSGNNNALLYDTLKEESREEEYSKYLGKTNSMYQVASILGGLAGGIILYFTSYEIIMWISVIPKLLNVIISLFIYEPKVFTENKNNIYSQAINSIKLVFKNKTLLKQVVADSISEGVGESTYQFRSKFYEMLWPEWALGIPGVLANIGLFLANWFSDKILKKVKNTTIMIGGYIYSFLSNLIGALLNNIWSPLVLVTNSVIPTNIVKEEISQKLYTDEYRASMASIKSLISSISMAIFFLLVGIIADNFGVVYTLAIMQCFKLIVILIYVNIFKTNKELIK
ncbi:MAG: MFS transporter [Clostridiales bacterium]|nr:MFS transporter [Clostridiales bacterium]